MNMTDIFAERRSIRRFTSQPVEQEKLEGILAAAQMAPSWGNMQCCELIVVRDAARREQLSEILSAKNPATLCLKNAPLVIGVAGTVKRSGFYKGVQVTRYAHWFLYDLGVVSQNICLKAWELGLGSVIVGSFAHEKAEQLLNIPAGVELVALIPIGYPDQQPAAPKRRALDEFVHYEQF
jgi:nitroreductase